MALELAAGLNSSAWDKAAAELEKVAAAPLGARRAEYQSLFVGPGRPSIWLYESQHLDGRLPGPATFQLKKLYEQGGLESSSAELPDHAALELEFLAYLTEQANYEHSSAKDWHAVRNLFIKNHAGRWLPIVGQQMVRSPYPAWAAIGYVLIASLSKETPKPAHKTPGGDQLFPEIMLAEDCTLCGFCVQVCPVQALKIHEDENTTELWLIPKTCTHCHKCEKVCDSKALNLSAKKLSAATLLRQSQRAICSACSTPTVSQAELKTVAAMLGEHPAWLDYCLDCRSQYRVN
jgi:TorA maturation chaperone TorD